jgi:AmpE protein
MTFIVILVAWLLLQWLGPGFMRPHDRWVVAWHLRAGNALAALPVRERLLLIAALPGVLVAVAAWLLSPWLWGLLLFPLDLLVLAYSLGRGDYHTELDRYLERWQRGDLEAAYQIARAPEGVGLNDEEIQPTDDAQQLHLQVRRAALYVGFERWFAVVFWFFVLGPGVALIYRLLHLLSHIHAADEAERAYLRRWLEWLDWLPARLLGLAFAVTGNFVNGFRAVREQFISALSVRDLLPLFAEQSVPAAIAGSQELGGEHFVELAANELRELRDLLRRSALCWLVVLALVQML